MKFNYILLASLLLTIACKNNTNSEVTAVEMTSESTEVAKTNYPETIAKVFETHGGIDKWNAMNNLCFQIDGRNGIETHTTDLNSRKAKIETEKYTMGFDGEQFWLSQEDSIYDVNRVKFYHNLMFYFHAMPFILGDDGITYEIVPDIEVDGATYNGTKISYGNDVGYSDNDNYIIYSNPETNQMEWLAYTVTYGKEESSDRYSFIKYADWQDVNGLVLPKTLQWYNVEDGKPTTMRNEMNFEKVTATETVLEDAVFEAPENAMIAE